ncbi:MAG: hypothetical protein HY539_04435 [Deltaproteobacteria bacterium]|nr:hypothetical protein [Deltaproteobacteria bacterium]
MTDNVVVIQDPEALLRLLEMPKMGPSAVSEILYAQMETALSGQAGTISLSIEEDAGRHLEAAYRGLNRHGRVDTVGVLQGVDMRVHRIARRLALLKLPGFHKGVPDRTISTGIVQEGERLVARAVVCFTRGVSSFQLAPFERGVALTAEFGLRILLKGKSCSC